MIFKNWTYRKRNKALWGIAIILLLAGWQLAFGKTYRLWREYKHLQKQTTTTAGGNLKKHLLVKQKEVQDSLLAFYRADSTLWVDGLLSQVGDVLSTHPVGVSYENKTLGNDPTLVGRTVELTGSFAQLQRALSALEKHFFIKSLEATVDREVLKYHVKVVVVKN